MVLAQKFTYRPVEQENPEINPIMYGKIIFDKCVWPFNRVKTVFLTDGAEKIGFPQAKERNQTPIFYHIQKLTQMDQRPEYKS